MLQQPEKEQAATSRLAAIEAKVEFIETGIQMRGCNRILTRAEQPAFEQGSNAMHSGHGDMCGIQLLDKLATRCLDPFSKAVVSFPAVGLNF